MKTRATNPGAGSPSRDLVDLADLLTQVRFNRHHADYRENSNWCVYAHPWPSEASRFDALITIRPRREGSGSREGLRLMLIAERRIWLTADATNRFGQVWFRQLPEAEYSAHLIRPLEYGPGSKRTEVREELPGAETEDRSPSLSATYVLPDRRIHAILSKGKTGSAVLTLQTSAQELAGVRVRFLVGKESGEVEFTPNRSASSWVGRYELSQPFHDAEQYIPAIDVRPPAGSYDSGEGDGMRLL